MSDDYLEEELCEENLWAVVRVKDRLFALDVKLIENMVAMPKITALPDTEPYLRGVMNLRGQTIPLLDLRRYIGMPSIQDEIDGFCTIMDQREQDHRNWLRELEASVKEHRPFTLATDHHKCAFGKWYDAFTTEDLTLMSLLRKFDAPHQKIHAIAKKVESYILMNQFDAAYSLISSTRDKELAQMIFLFEQVRHTVRDSAQREIAIVLHDNSRQVAVSVDKVESIESLDEKTTDIEDIFPEKWKKLILSVGRRNSGEDLVLFLKSDLFFESCSR